MSRTKCHIQFRNVCLSTPAIAALTVSVPYCFKKRRAHNAAPPIHSGQIPANVAPAYSAYYSYPREDDSSSFSDMDSNDSFSDIDSSVPMSAFMRSMADEAEAMEDEFGTSTLEDQAEATNEELNEDDESLPMSL
jgi:hypothetical protein